MSQIRKGLLRLLKMTKIKSSWEKPKMLICRYILNFAKNCITNYFWPKHHKVQYVYKKTLSKLQNVSPSKLSSNVHRSRYGSNSIFKDTLFLSGDWTILERQITDDSSQFETPKSISSEDIFAKWHKFLSSILQNICKRLRHVSLPAVV